MRFYFQVPPAEHTNAMSLGFKLNKQRNEFYKNVKCKVDLPTIPETWTYISLQRRQDQARARFATKHPILALEQRLRCKQNKEEKSESKQLSEDAMWLCRNRKLLDIRFKKVRNKLINDSNNDVKVINTFDKMMFDKKLEFVKKVIDINTGKFIT